MRSGPDVSIILVSHDSAADLRLSLASALAQTGVDAETLVVDNASTDASREVVRKFGTTVRLIPMAGNVGFAAAMNAGIDASAGRYVVALNPDCRLDTRFAEALTGKLDSRPDVGSASGRIYRADGPDLSPTSRLDSG